jgi:hypothetical protein
MFEEQHEDEQEVDCEGRKICFDCFDEQFGYCDGEGCGTKIKYSWAFRQIDGEDVDGVWCDKCWEKEKARLLELE